MLLFVVFDLVFVQHGVQGSWVQIPPSRLTNTIAGHARVLCLWPGRWNLVVATRLRLVASVPNPTVPTY